MKIVLINKRFTPLRSATGFHSYQLAMFLQNQGHTITLIHTAPKNVPELSSEHAIPHRKYISSFYNGKQILLRFVGALIDSIKLLRLAKQVDADRYIVLSDPPVLQLVSTFYLNPSKTVFWFMDVYPQAFVAHGLIKKTNRLLLSYIKRLRSFNPSVVISLGKMQSAYLNKAFGYNHIISLPIGLQNIQSSPSKTQTDWYVGDHLIYFLYKGNLGSAHDLSFLTSLASTLDHSKHRFIICSEGIKSRQLYKRINHNNSIVFADHINESDLYLIDIHIVTLLAKWTHICVPSKALLAASTKGTVLFHGTIDSDTWHYINEIGWHISEQFQENDEISQFLKSITKESIRLKKLKAQEVYTNLSQELSNGYKLIESQMR